MSVLSTGSWCFGDLLSPSNSWSSGGQKRSSGWSGHSNATNVGWNEPLVPPLSQMLLRETYRIEFANARIKSFNRYWSKGLENKPECPGGFLAVLWNAVRRIEFMRDYSECKLLSFIHIHAKHVRWANITLYLWLAGISPECCCKENFPNQSLRLCVSFCTSPQLSLSVKQ